MTTTQKHYYIVEVTLREMKAFDGSVLTKAGSKAYLGESDGYYAIGPYPKHFKTPPNKETIFPYDGMPWYNRIDTARVFEINESITHTVTKNQIATY